MRAFAGREVGALCRKPPLELAALHFRIINNFVYFCAQNPKNGSQ
jgi:hypothetical protein